MASINLYENSIKDKQMSLVVSKYNSKISECELFGNKEFILIGVSLGNSYFSEERLELIIRGFSKSFQRVAILLVDDLAKHNFKAMGYDEKKIKKKIKNSANHTSNRIKGVIDRTNNLYKKNNIKFYKWSYVESFEAYHNSLEDVAQLYKSDALFRQNIFNTTSNVIKKYLNSELIQESVEEAKWYFLKELAFGCSINQIFKEEKVLTSYYEDFKFYREFFETSFLNFGKEKNEELIIYNCNETMN